MSHLIVVTLTLLEAALIACRAPQRWIKATQLAIEAAKTACH